MLVVTAILLVAGAVGALSWNRTGVPGTGDRGGLGGAPPAIIEFGATTAINVTGTPDGPGGCSGPGAGSTAYCFVVPVQWVTTGMAITNLTLSVQASLFNRTAVGENITLLDPSGVLIATLTFGSVWTPVGTGATLPDLVAGDRLIVNAGDSASALGCGAELTGEVQWAGWFVGVTVDFPSPLPPIASLIEFGAATLVRANGSTNQLGGCTGPGAGLIEYCYGFRITAVSAPVTTDDVIVTATNLADVPVNLVNATLMSPAEAILATYAPGMGWQEQGPNRTPVLLAADQWLLLNFGTDPGDGFHVYVHGTGPTSCWVNLWANWPDTPMSDVFQIGNIEPVSAIGTTPGPGGCAAPGTGHIEDCFQWTVTLAKENFSTDGLSLVVTDESQAGLAYQNITLLSPGGTLLAVYYPSTGWFGFGGASLPVHLASGQVFVVNVGVDTNPQVQVHFADAWFAGFMTIGFGG